MKFINIFIIYGLIIEPLKDQGPVSRKSRERFGPEKPFVKLRPAYSVKLVFSYVIKGIKVKVTAKFRASRRLRFEDTKRIIARNKAGKFSRLSRNRHQGPVSRKPRNFSGVFRVTQFSLYLQNEGVSRHETLQLFLFLFPLQQVKRSALQNKQVVILRMAYRARKVLGTFEKRAPAPS